MEFLIVELVVPVRLEGISLISFVAKHFPEIELDETYSPVEISPRAEDISRLSQDEKVVVVRGRLRSKTRAEVEQRPEVLHIWSDGRVEPFNLE